MPPNAKLPHELVGGAYADSENPIVHMNLESVRRLSLTSIEKSKPDSPRNDDKHPLVFAHRTRYLVLGFATACLTLVMANSLALNFTVICMVKDDDSTTTPANGTHDGATSKPRYLFNDSQRSWLFSAIAVGTIAGTLPISYLNNRFGFRQTVTFYGLSSAFSTLLIPLGVNWGFGFVLVLRIVQGFAVSTSFPAIGSIATEWAPLKHSGTFIAYLSTHLQLGTILVMPLAGELCESPLGWQSVYYILGVSTLVLFLGFYFFYRDSPAVHRNVSNKELSKLQKDKVIRELEDKKRPMIPYRAIFTDYSFLGILASCIGGSFGFQLFFQYGPLYLNKILKFDVQNTGFAAAMPAVGSMLLKFVAGPMSDHVPYLNDKWRVIMFASISQFAMAGCFGALAFLPEGSRGWGQFFYTGSVVFSGLNCVGVSKSVQLISGRFSYVLMAASQLVMSLSTLYIPFMVQVFAPENTSEEWARLFIFAAVLIVIVTMIFNVTAEATPRPWAYEAPSGRSSAKTTFASLHGDFSHPQPQKEDHKLAAPVRFDLDFSQIGTLQQVNRVLNEKKFSVISENLRNEPSRQSINSTTPRAALQFTETVKLEKIDL